MENFQLHVEKISCVRNQQSVFSDLNFQLTSGQTLLVQGANGSGKSSLLKIISGLAFPTEGNIFWNQKNIATQLESYWPHIHFISHNNGLKLELTAKENLHLLTTMAMQKQSSSICDTLSILKLQDVSHLPAKFLSAGQKRRLALAKLFLFKRNFWILDEPTTALDQETQDLFLNHLQSHLANGGMSLISTHQTIPLPNFSTRIMRMKEC